MPDDDIRIAKDGSSRWASIYNMNHETGIGTIIPYHTLGVQGDTWLDATKTGGAAYVLNRDQTGHGRWTEGLMQAERS